MKSLKSVLNTKYPIIAGPMAWTSLAPLVGAVANAGALGVLGVGFSPSQVVEEQIKATRQITDQPFAINVTISNSADENLARITEIAKKYNIEFIYADNFEGLDADHTERWFGTWHQDGIKVIAKVSSAEEARVADQAGADVIVAKGWEGGGHISHEGTFALIPQVVNVVQNAPVVASGGIADGRGYAAARALGADGVEMGTAFLAAEEGAISKNIKNAVVDADSDDLVVTGMSTGAPCWQIKNGLSEKLNNIEKQYVPSVAAPKVAELASGSLRIASTEGEIDQRGAVMPGQVVTLVKNVKPVATILADVYNDGNKRLKAISSMIEAD